MGGNTPLRLHFRQRKLAGSSPRPGERDKKPPTNFTNQPIKTILRLLADLVGLPGCRSPVALLPEIEILPPMVMFHRLWILKRRRPGCRRERVYGHRHHRQRRLTSLDQHELLAPDPKHHFY